MSDPEGTEYGTWLRDASGVTVCRCGHLANEHRLDSRGASNPCSRPACGCRTVRAGFVLYREHRTVLIPWPPST